jgi:hypothetical protein
VLQYPVDSNVPLFISKSIESLLDDQTFSIQSYWGVYDAISSTEAALQALAVVAETRTPSNVEIEHLKNLQEQRRKIVQDLISSKKQYSRNHSRLPPPDALYTPCFNPRCVCDMTYGGENGVSQYKLQWISFLIFSRIQNICNNRSSNLLSVQREFTKLKKTF